MSASSSMVRDITRLLSPPSKIASALDWRKAAGGVVLSVHLGASSIDLSVLTHPSEQVPIQPLPSIPTSFETRGKSRVLKTAVLTELAQVTEKWKVCGFVVSWPVQKEGWTGASCGRVLHMLQQIVDDTNMVTPARPVCLWDGNHFHLPADEWGRVPRYGAPVTFQKEVHIASQEQYSEYGMVSAGVARDYLRHHWPELARDFAEDKPKKTDKEWAVSGKRKHKQHGQQQQRQTQRSTFVVDPQWLEAYSTCAVQKKAAL